MLAFRRPGTGMVCVTNVSGRPVVRPADVPSSAGVLLATVDLRDDGRLPADATVWFEDTS